jgi:Caspase domain
MEKAKNWAIVVGINAYEHIGQLRYANRDAAALRDFFQEAKFDRVFCFADGLPLAPERDQKSVQPRHSDLVDFLHDRFTTKTPPLSAVGLIHSQRRKSKPLIPSFKLSSAIDEEESFQLSSPQNESALLLIRGTEGDRCRDLQYLQFQLV